MKLETVYKFIPENEHEKKLVDIFYDSLTITKEIIEKSREDKILSITVAEE